jgi:hypothetical protein
MLVMFVTACEGLEDLVDRPQSTVAKTEFEGSITLGLGKWKLVDVPGGQPQTAYVTIPGAETLSNIAEAHRGTTTVGVFCRRLGNAWVRVKTGNGYWKIYSLNCYDDQGGGI